MWRPKSAPNNVAMLTQKQQNLMKPSRRAALESAVGNVYSEEFLRAFELPSMDQKCQRMVHATASLVLLVILMYQVSSKLPSTAAGERVVLSTGTWIILHTGYIHASRS